MKSAINHVLFLASSVMVTCLLTGCWGSRYVSADKSLEDIYVGKSYYEIESDFGRPDATGRDGMEGTRLIYYQASLSGSQAASLYKEREVRNRQTKETGSPEGTIVFSLKPDMRCYAVNTNLQLRRVKEAKPEKRAPVDRTNPIWAKQVLPRTLDFPHVEGRSPLARYVSIEQIEMTQEQTVVHFVYKERTPKHRPVIDSGIFVNRDLYIEDCATGHRYTMVETDGIGIWPKSTRFAHNVGGYDMLVYSVTFPPLPVGTEFINIIEPGHTSYNFYRVDVRKSNALIELEKR